MSKIAIVTGSNKGIGYGIVKTLSSKLSKDWTIYLTARNEELGKKSLEDFKGTPVTVKFHQLDITDSKSVAAICQYMKETHGKVNLLINNAGIAFKQAATEPFAEQVEITHRTNFFSTLNFSNAMLPLMAENSHMIHVSSFVSLMTLGKLGPELYKKFTSPMTMTELISTMEDLVKRSKAGTFAEAGWPETAYGTSKLAVTKMTEIQAKELENDARNVVVNCCCPGYVATDMSSHKGHLTIEQGADTPCFLALMEVNKSTPRGKFFSERKEKEWK